MNASFDFLNLSGIRTTSHGRTEVGIVVEAETIDPKFETLCCLDQQLAPDGARANRRVINDTPHGGDRVVIMMKVKRAKCKACGKKGMIEALPGVHPNRLMTQRLFDHLAHQALIRTNTRIGEAVGVTEGTVRSILKEYVDERLRDRHIETPRVIGLDEKMLRGEYRCVVCNLEESTVIDLLENRDHALTAFLAALPDKHRVEVVVADMYGSFHRAQKRFFPNALHVYDHFHVVQRANNAMDKVRAAVANTLAGWDRKNLAQSKKLFLQRHEAMSEGGRYKIKEWSERFPILGDAYWAKERYFEMYEYCHTPAEAEWYYKNWEKTLPIEVRLIFMKMCSIKAGQQARAVFAFFDEPYTTGYIEGVNRQLDDIQRAGRGYSWEIIRGKLLLSPKLTKQTFRERALRVDVPSISERIDFGQDFALFGLTDIIQEPLEFRDPEYKIFVQLMAEHLGTTTDEYLRSRR